MDVFEHFIGSVAPPEPLGESLVSLGVSLTGLAAPLVGTLGGPSEARRDTFNSSGAMGGVFWRRNMLELWGFPEIGTPQTTCSNDSNYSMI